MTARAMNHKRSSKEAQETFTRAHDSAVRTYGEGDQAYRVAYAELKRTFEKRGDHWIPRQPSAAEDLRPLPTVGVWMSWPPRAVH